MKKYAVTSLTLTVVAALVAFISLPAQALEDSVLSPKEVLSQIQQSQNATSINQLNCSQVTEDQFAQLGDALMTAMHPGEAHEYMDQMMGGEGSESLLVRHVSMGQQYLGCTSGYGYTSPGYGMMGGYTMMPGVMGMMGSSMMGQYPALTKGTTTIPWRSAMMGWSSGSGVSNFATGVSFILMLLFWALVILGLVWLIRSLWFSGDVPKSSGARAILNERYARGEISQEQFMEIKKNLKL